MANKVENVQVDDASLIALMEPEGQETIGVNYTFWIDDKECAGRLDVPTALRVTYEQLRQLCILDALKRCKLSIERAPMPIRVEKSDK